MHPPLARLLVALSAWLAGFDGRFEFEEIGLSYAEHHVPYIQMRMFQAALASGVVPLVFRTLRTTGSPVVTSLMCALLLLFDNAHETQARFIFLDSPLLLFMTATLYSYVCFYTQRYREFSAAWWGWLLSTGFFLGATISCKMVGLFGFFTVGAAVVYDLWNLWDIRRGLSVAHVAKHFFARAVALIVWPFMLYLATFAVHFKILNRSGSGDSFMSTRFQESLAGSEPLVSTLELHAFDTITLRHRVTNAYLQAHAERYPLKYDDGRISSEGQQVTASPQNGTNSYWQIIPVDSVDDEDGTFNLTRRKLHHKQQLRLLHVETQSFLRSHDVASPLMPVHEEMTTVPRDELEDSAEDTLFELQIEGARSGSRTWYAGSSRIRLIHVPTRVCVWTHAQELPEWGFHHQEVNGNKNALDRTGLWSAEVVQLDPESPMIDVRSKLPPPKDPKPLGFIPKYLELQGTMFRENNALTQSHPYASRPISWPFLLQGVLYWDKVDVNAQVFLVGNVFVWWLCIAGVSVFGGIMGADLLLRRRGIYNIPTVVRQRLLHSTGFFAWAWLCHYLPFFTMSRQLFLHHYLPAHICSVLVFAGVFDFIAGRAVNGPLSPPGPLLDPERRRPMLRMQVTNRTWIKAAFIIACAVAVFIYLLPINIGIDLVTPQAIEARRVFRSWNLQSFDVSSKST